MISSYISYLRLINDKLIRNGINLGITLKDDMSVDELEDAKAILESYCYFNDVLTLCDSAYALDLVDGCKVKLYTDLVKEEVYAQYNEKFEMASTLLQSGMDNPLDEVKEPLTLNGYLQSLGKSSVKDLAVSVSAEEPKKVSVENLGDLFNISNEPKFDYVEDDSDEDEEFDYSDDEEETEEQEETSEDEEDDDSNVFFDFRNQSDGDEDSNEEEFDYSDDSEVFENAEELPLTNDEDEELAEFDYSDDNEEVSDSDEEEDFNYSDDEEVNDTSEAGEEDSDEEEFDYSDDTEDSEDSEEDFNYSDDEYSEDGNEVDSEGEEPDDVYSEDDEDFNYSDDDGSSEDEEEDFDYSDDEDADGYSEDDEDIDYSDDNDDSEEDIDYSDDNESEEDYDEDYEEETSGYDEEPMFNVGTSPHVQTAPRPKEAYEKDAELIEGIVDGGAKLLKSVGSKFKTSLFNGKK